MGSKFFYKGLETVESGEGYTFKQNLTSSQVNTRNIVLKLQLMQMCAKKESWWRHSLLDIYEVLSNEEMFKLQDEWEEPANTMARMTST